MTQIDILYLTYARAPVSYPLIYLGKIHIYLAVGLLSRVSEMSSTFTYVLQCTLDHPGDGGTCAGIP